MGRVVVRLGVWGWWLFAGQAAIADDVLDRVLSRIPAATPQARQALESDLLTLDEAQLDALFRQVVGPEQGGDASVRLAVHALALMGGRPNAGAVKTRLERAMLARLRSDAPPDVKDFFLEQVRLVATDEAIEPVALLLRDDALVERATTVLVSVGGERAVQALRSALPGTKGKARLCILHALGTLQDGQAAFEAVATSDPADVEMWRTLLFALSASGSPAMEALLDLMLNDTTGEAGEVSSYQRSVERDLALRYLERATKVETATDGVERLRSLLRTSGQGGNTHVGCAALGALVAAIGPAALPDAVQALGSEERELAAAAAEVLVTLQDDDVVPRLLDACSRSSPAVQVQLLGVLGRRGDGRAFPVCADYLSSSDRDVRLAAAQASLSLGGARAIPRLLPELESSSREGRIQIENALFALRGNSVDSSLADALKASSSPVVKASMLAVLGRREATGKLEVVLQATEDPSGDVRRAAYRTLERIESCAAVDRVLSRVIACEDAEERECAAAALAAGIRQCPDRSEKVGALAAMIRNPQASGRAALIRGLVLIGAPEGLSAVRECVNDATPEVREAAVQAICDWPGGEALTDCLHLAERTAELADHVRAMRGYLRLLGEAGGMSIGERMESYRTAIGVARRPEERKLAISGLSRLSVPEALTILAPFLADPHVGAEAAMATIQLADRLVPGHCVEARNALDAVSVLVLPETMRIALQGVVEKLNRFEDHITDWWASGPYIESGKRGQDLCDMVFPPERPGAEGVTWRELTPAQGDRAWVADLGASAWLAGDMRVAYLRTRVFSPVTQALRLEVGSDDGIKVWLNGAAIHTNNTLRGCAPSQDIIPVTLHEGWNDLMLKVMNDGGAWSAAARFRSLEGGHVEGIYARRDASP